MAEKMVSSEPQKKSGAGKVILAVILTLLLGGGGAAAGVYFFRQTEIDSQKSDNQKTIDGLKKQFTDVSTKVTDLENIQKNLEKEKADLEEQLKAQKEEEKDAVFTGTGETSIKFSDGREIIKDELPEGVNRLRGGVVQDPSDKDTVYYFIDSNKGVDNADGSYTTKNELIKYNIKTKKFESIYKEETLQHEMWIIGIAGNSLIILKQPLSDDRGQCVNRWIMTTSNGVLEVAYFSFEPGKDTKPQKYTVSDSKIEKEKKKQEECKKEL